jgi:hypothetical protein
VKKSSPRPAFKLNKKFLPALIAGGGLLCVALLAGLLALLIWQPWQSGEVVEGDPPIVTPNEDSQGTLPLPGSGEGGVDLTRQPIKGSLKNME